MDQQADPADRRTAETKALARSRIRAIAVDGKTSRGARPSNGTRVRPLGVVEHGGPLLDREIEGLPRDRPRDHQPVQQPGQPEDLARLVRGHRHLALQHHIRDVSFGVDTSAGRTGHGPVNLAAIRASVAEAGIDAG